MDSVQATSAQHSLVDHKGNLNPISNDVKDKTIAAYYSLIFPTYTFYLQTLNCSIGRRTVATSGPSVEDNFKVDVDLGPLKSVSRLHAKIEYDYDVESFVISVVGRNGAWIDGVWAKAGSRVALGEHTQIQIASRIFQFVLPPSPLPQDDASTPSPSSSSGVRGRSPSVDIDITSISPASSPPLSPPHLTSGPVTPKPKSHGPPTGEPPDPPHLDLDIDLDIEESEEEPRPVTPPPRPVVASKTYKPKPRQGPPSPKLPNSNSIPRHTVRGPVKPQLTFTTPAPASASEDAEGSSSLNSKKRKKGPKQLIPDPSWTRPAPEDMPPKPPYTYAQLIYRAIKGIGEKATLQEICNWIMTEFDYYKWCDGAWMSSVRHNLSSSKAFKKLERCGGDRGKGFFWAVEEALEHTFIEQEAKMLQAQSGQGSSQASGTKGGKKKGGAPLSDPPLKRSVKGDKNTPLPPPLTTVPLVSKSALDRGTNFTNATTSTYPTNTAVNGSSIMTNSATPASHPPQWGQYGHQQQQQHHQAFVARPVAASPPAPPSIPVINSPVPISSAVTSPPISSVNSSGSFASASGPTAVNSAAHTPAPAAGGTAAAAQAAVAQFSASIAFLDPNSRVPIVIGLPPNAAPVTTQSTPSATDPSSSSLTFTSPPMSLHANSIYLDPSVFGHLTPEQVTGLEGLGMQKSLELLRGYMARFLKQKMGKKKKDKKKKDKDRKKKDKGGEVEDASGDVTMQDAQQQGNFKGDAPVDIDGDPGSPILVIDDDDDDEESRLAKKPRLG